VSWLRCQKIAGLEYWVQLLFNFTPVRYAKGRPGLISAGLEDALGMHPEFTSKERCTKNPA